MKKACIGYNPHTSLTHSTGLSEEEIKIFADTGAVLFHGPTTRANIKKRCPVYEVLRAGGEVAIDKIYNDFMHLALSGKK